MPTASTPRHEPLNRRYPHHHEGFTLLELMITVAVLAILLGIGIPSFNSVIASSQLTSQTNRIVAALNAARMEAVKRNTHAVICTSSNGTACNGTSWASGWLIFMDSNKDGSLGTGEDIFAKAEAYANVTAVGNTNVSSKVRFQADGTIVPVLVGTIRICKTTTAVSENARDIVINAGGRARVERKALSGSCPAP